MKLMKKQIISTGVKSEIEKNIGKRRTMYNAAHGQDAGG
jgi:hypothetical protein